MIPGELFIKDGEIELNAGRKTVTLTVANTGDRPIQVGSHYHFFETNPALKFDRKKARGMRLDIAAGTAVRFEPGQTRDVQLVALAGKRVVYGFRGDDAGEAVSAMLTGLRLGLRSCRFRGAPSHWHGSARGAATSPTSITSPRSRTCFAIVTDGDRCRTRRGRLAARHHRGHRQPRARSSREKFGERVAALVVEVTDDMSASGRRSAAQKQIVDAPGTNRRAQS